MIVLVGTMAVAAALDVKDRRIPNWLTLTGLLLALFVRALPGGPVFLPGITGFLVAFVLVLPLFAFGLLGGGDAKLFMVVGALLGPVPFLISFLYASVAGGLMALAAAGASGGVKTLLYRTMAFATMVATMGKRGLRMSVSEPSAVTIPYGVAIAVGALVAYFLPFTG